jgi:hypothetical protein
MATGIDYTSHTTVDLANKIKSSGYDFVCRYLAPDSSSWKKLTKDEAQILLNAGLNIVSVWEQGAKNALGGKTSGTADGKLAFAEAIKVGQPKGSAIYFAIDFEASASQMDAIEAYLNAAGDQITGYEVGVYGSYSVIEEMAKRGACKHFWQTLAWSQGKKSSHANLYQSDNDVKELGLDIDHDESYENVGFWIDNTKKGDKKMDFTIQEWQQLGNALDGLYHKGLINDYTWADKAYKQELSAEQIARLNMIIFARSQGIDTDKNIQW